MIDRLPLETVARTLRAFWAGEGGSSAAEYAILLFVLSGCGVCILHALGHRMDRTLLRAAAAIAHR